MLKLNLFYEQQQIQRDKDLDPIRIAIVLGVLITLGILAWATFIYFRLEPLRKGVEANQLTLKNKKEVLSRLGTPTDLPKIQSQSDALYYYQMNRILIAPQLETIRNTLPTNCFIRLFSVTHEVKDFMENDIKKTQLNASMFCEANATSSDKVALLQIRDHLIESFRKEPGFRPWIQQVPSTIEAGVTNFVNSVIEFPSVTKDPNLSKDAKSGENQYRGFFEFKMPFVIKDLPQVSDAK
jgi:hypothetical protein